MWTQPQAQLFCFSFLTRVFCPASGPPPPPALLLAPFSSFVAHTCLGYLLFPLAVSLVFPLVRYVSQFFLISSPLALLLEWFSFSDLPSKLIKSQVTIKVTIVDCHFKRLLRPKKKRNKTVFFVTLRVTSFIIRARAFLDHIPVRSDVDCTAEGRLFEFNRNDLDGILILRKPLCIYL